MCSVVHVAEIDSLAGGIVCSVITEVARLRAERTVMLQRSPSLKEGA